MCGRFSNSTHSDAVKTAFGVSATPGDNAKPHWNIAPGHDIETVISSSTPDKNLLAMMRWGRDVEFKSGPLINARSETMFEKPTFRQAAEKRRCIVVASGWFEWKKPKKPYYIKRRDAAPLGMAGLYWQKDDIRHCVIVTTAAEGSLSDIHHRAPLVLADDAVSSWLDPDTPSRVLDAIIAPAPAETFNWYPVSAEVGSTRNNHEGLIEPDPEHGAQTRPKLKLF
jgi:putative SOS response-associated peptidase YedK